MKIRTKAKRFGLLVVVAVLVCQVTVGVFMPTSVDAAVSPISYDLSSSDKDAWNTKAYLLAMVTCIYNGRIKKDKSFNVTYITSTNFQSPIDGLIEFVKGGLVGVYSPFVKDGENSVFLNCADIFTTGINKAFGITNASTFSQQKAILTDTFKFTCTPKSDCTGSKDDAKVIYTAPDQSTAATAIISKYGTIDKAFYAKVVSYFIHVKGSDGIYQAKIDDSYTKISYYDLSLQCITSGYVKAGGKNSEGFAGFPKMSLKYQAFNQNLEDWLGASKASALIQSLGLQSCDTKINIIFKANGGKWGDGKTEQTQQFDYGTFIVPYTAPTWDNHTFTGWLQQKPDGSLNNQKLTNQSDRAITATTFYAAWDTSYQDKAAETTDPNNPDGNTPSTPPCESQEKKMGWVLCPIKDGVYWGIDWIDQQIISMFDYKTLGNETGAEVMRAAWSGFRDLANIGFAIVFLIIIYSTAVGGKLG